MTKKYDLTSGNSNLISAISSSYPKLSDLEVNKLGNLLLNEVSKRIANGEQMAFMKPRHDGKIELTVIGFNLIPKKKP